MMKKNNFKTLALLGLTFALAFSAGNGISQKNQKDSIFKQHWSIPASVVVILLTSLAGLSLGVVNMWAITEIEKQIEGERRIEVKKVK